MLARLKRLRDRIRAYPGLWASSSVGRVFMVCGGESGCGRVVPMWRLVATKEERALERIGCTCGNGIVVARTISEWRAGYWVLVRSFLIRRVILRKANWDCRAPVRGGGFV